MHKAAFQPLLCDRAMTDRKRRGGIYIYIYIYLYIERERERARLNVTFLLAVFSVTTDGALKLDTDVDAAGGDTSSPANRSGLRGDGSALASDTENPKDDVWRVSLLGASLSLSFSGGGGIYQLIQLVRSAGFLNITLVRKFHVALLFGVPFALCLRARTDEAGAGLRMRQAIGMVAALLAAVMWPFEWKRGDWDGAAFLLYGVSVSLMWLRTMQYVMVHESLGQVPHPLLPSPPVRKWHASPSHPTLRHSAPEQQYPSFAKLALITASASASSPCRPAEAVRLSLLCSHSAGIRRSLCG